MNPDQAQFQALQSALAGRFFVEREIGRGGMGVVYLARDVALDRPVAIKVLPAEMTRDVHHRERFLREARTAAGLAHPNIVPVHLVESRDDLVCFIMGYISGETLGERVLRTGPLPPDEVVRIVREVAWALGYAHGRGVIHRDIKPDNILLEHGTDRALVTDFGIARVSAEGTLSRQDEIIGTLQYMPPEQADAGAELDGRSDIYALGVTAFYALTGRLPFESTSAPALLAMHLSEPAPPVTSVRPGIPARLAGAVDRCLAKEPSARFANAELLADALGEMAVSKAIPPSILALREASTTAGLLIYLPGFLYFVLGVGIQPDWAPALATVWASLGTIGTLSFLVSTRAVVRAGHSTKEVGEAARQIIAASLQDRNAIITREQTLKLSRYLGHPVGRVVLAGMGFWYLLLSVNVIIEVFFGETARDLWDLWAALGVISFLGIGIALLAGSFHPSLIRGRMEDPFKDERRGKKLKNWAKKFWDNPIMRGIFRFAGLGAAPPKMGSQIVEQGATEVLLGQAAYDLFSSLPEADRQRLSEVPIVVRQLEAAAGALRSRREELERALADAGAVAGGETSKRADIVNEIESARAEAAERLQRVVTALENLRLDLLRLRAGVGDAAEITGAIEAARQVGVAVAAEIEGKAQVERLT